MSHHLVTEGYIFILAMFVGFLLISKIPPILHTPLMSATNAIHGVVLIGALSLLTWAHGPLNLTIGLLAVFLATLNVVGGFVVTDRILGMFRTPSNGGR